MSAVPHPAVVWHDLECGGYREDLVLWRGLAERHPGAVLDIGAGSGRVTLDLAARGAAVTALDRDPDLLAALVQRAAARGLAVDTLLADARRFTVDVPFALCLVPMQTVQLFADATERGRFLACAHAALRPGGRLALAIAEALEPFDVADGALAPLPDVGEFAGSVYSSRPLAIRQADGGFVLERRRETVTPAGDLLVEPDAVRLAALDAATLEAEARAAGFAVAPRAAIATTADYVGSAVVMLDA